MRKTTLAFVALAALPACGGGSTIPLANLSGSSGPLAAPAARGNVKASKGENDNTKLQISVKHLVEPQRLVPGTTTYVVWARGLADPTSWYNLGALRVGPELEGNLRTVTALREFDVLITPEATARVPSPVHPAVLAARVSRN